AIRRVMGNSSSSHHRKHHHHDDQRRPDNRYASHSGPLPRPAHSAPAGPAYSGPAHSGPAYSGPASPGAACQHHSGGVSSSSGGGGGGESYSRSSSFGYSRALQQKYGIIPDTFRSIAQVQEKLREVGLESSNLIVAVDFTKSNEWTGKQSFNGRSLHAIAPGASNPYEQAIDIIGQTLSAFDEDNLIPCYGFGDVSTHDKAVFAFNEGQRPCNGFEEALQRYRAITPLVQLSGPTSFAPAIEAAVRAVEESGGQYHVLLIIADGQVTRSVDTPPGVFSRQEQATVDAIVAARSVSVAASNYALSIVMVGVGDGPWDTMEEFDDALPQRNFDNFQFVNFTQVMAAEKPRFDPDPAVQALCQLHAGHGIITRAGSAHSTLSTLMVMPLPPPLSAPFPPPTSVCQLHEGNGIITCTRAAGGTLCPLCAHGGASSVPRLHRAGTPGTAPLFAVSALMEVPHQYRACTELGMQGRPMGRLPPSAPKEPPPRVRAADAAAAQAASLAAANIPPHLNPNNLNPSDFNPGNTPNPFGNFMDAPAAYGYGAGSSATPTGAAAAADSASGSGGASAAGGGTECPVCLMYPKNTAFQCGHQTCEECGKQMNNCPICRAPVTMRIKLYS
ncbi:unnamed protein product, partial [Closterium sp. Naga37s-1]